MAVLQSTMSSSEFAEWRAYSNLEPFGEERADLRAAMVPFMLACVFHAKGRPDPEFGDFLIDNFVKAGVEEQTVDQMKAVLSLVGKVVEKAKEHGDDR